MGIRCQVLLTHVNGPVGKMIGQSLEIQEAIWCLNGEGPPDLFELVCTIGKLVFLLLSSCPVRHTRQRDIQSYQQPFFLNFLGLCFSCDGSSASFFWASSFPFPRCQYYACFGVLIGNILRTRARYLWHLLFNIVNF